MRDCLTVSVLSSILKMLQYFVLVIVLGSAVYFGEAIKYTETILTSGGSIRGEEVEIHEIKFKAFRGIPYAAPPVGELRFKDPHPPNIWEDVKDTVEFGHICHQGIKVEDDDMNTPKPQTNTSTKPTLKNQDEDCLTLNVYTKVVGDEVAQPVLFSIHGGGFFAGDGTDNVFGPEFLVQQDLVVVTFNYRVGPLGFLSTNSSDAPGNWGLKDQVYALKWVQENIENFGGDPKQVTIYGESAGATSVHYHMMSPQSKGLFQRAIMSSGAAGCAWSSTNDQERFAKNLARHLGASEKQLKDSEKLVKFLQQVDAKELTTKMWEALDEEDFKNGLSIPVPFLPVVEPSNAKGAFLSEDPLKILSEGNIAKIPLMMGFNDLEGGLALLTPRFQEPEELKKLDQDLCLAVPQNLREVIKKKNDCQKVSEEIRKLYFGGKPIEGDRLNLAHMIGDSIAVHGIYYAEQIHAQWSTGGHSAYYYYFSYDGEWNMMKKVFPVDLPGALHGDEITYIFNPTIIKLPFRKPSKAGLDTKGRMISFVSHFVKTGNPTPTESELVPFLWEPAKKDELNTMLIGADIKMGKDVLKERMDFWEELYRKYIGGT